MIRTSRLRGKIARCKKKHIDHLPIAFMYSSKFSVWTRFHVPAAKSAMMKTFQMKARCVVPERENVVRCGFSMAND